MSERRVEVPEGMIDAVLDRDRVGGSLRENTRFAVEAALQWLVANPQVPTDEQHFKIREKWDKTPNHGGAIEEDYTTYVIAEFQRRFMFTEPEPEPDAELRSFLSVEIGVNWQDPHCAHMVEIATKAYKRGQQSMIRKDGGQCD